MNWDLSLSPSKLNLLRTCRRCFYDANVLKIEQPRGIFPSLPGGVDRVMKEVMDTFRGGMMPPLDQELRGVLWGTVEQITKLRNWRSGLKAILPIRTKHVSLIGALDDVLLEPDHRYSPFDTKTKGSEPKDDGAEYYQDQLDCYALLLKENGMPPSGKAYLCYWFPVLMAGATMQWNHKLYHMTADPDRARALLERAVDVLTGGQPDANPMCEQCRFAQVRVSAALKTIQV